MVSQILGGTLTFSDGSVVKVGTLDNSGGAYVVKLQAPITTTTVLLYITKVSATTKNIGLSEIQVFGPAYVLSL